MVVVSTETGSWKTPFKDLASKLLSPRAADSLLMLSFKVIRPN